MSIKKKQSANINSQQIHYAIFGTWLLIGKLIQPALLTKEKHSIHLTTLLSRNILQSLKKHIADKKSTHEA